ncbi:MAG: hypothetical protein JST54_26475 [Deltaproteobacteria bacterium]|nr:hypothetical protein [Deltaproteobacteria bacterium]
MSAALPAPAVAPRRTPWLLAPLAVGAPLCLLALFVTDGSLVLVLAPLAGLGVLAFVLFGRLRTSAMILLLAGLALENPSERPANGMWRSPLYPLGALLLDKLNNVTGIHALRFTGLDAAMLLLASVLVYRRWHGIELDRRGQVQTARPLGQAATVSLAAIIGLWGYGLATGGDFQNSLWQVQKPLYVPLLALFFQASFQGPRDHELLAKIVVGAALWKAATALYVRHLFPWLSDEALPYVNTHSDSALYATAFTLLVAAFLLKPSRARLLRCVLLLPLLAEGMIANNRRLVWVELAAVLATLLLFMPRTRLKRKLARGAVMATPFAILYLAIGWNSGSTIFKPARTMRSVVSSDTDSSSRSRDIENFNLVMTTGAHMLLGQGFGHEYEEHVVGDDISHVFPQYRYIPHNSLLGLWSFGGWLGYTGLTAILSAGVFLAARAFRMARDPDHRVAAFVSIAVVAIYLLQGYGDMGVFSWLSTFLLAAALATAAKLAVAVRAWPSRQAEPARAQLAPEGTT